jgi:hypothetical protein
MIPAMKPPPDTSSWITTCPIAGLPCCVSERERASRVLLRDGPLFNPALRNVFTQSTAFGLVCTPSAAPYGRYMGIMPLPPVTERGPVTDDQEVRIARWRLSKVQ